MRKPQANHNLPQAIAQTLAKEGRGHVQTLPLNLKRTPCECCEFNKWCRKRCVGYRKWEKFQ